MYTTAIVHELIQRIYLASADSSRWPHFLELLREQTGAANRFDNARHAFTLGYGVNLGGARLSLAYQHHELVPRLHHKSGAVPSDNPGFPEVKTRGSVDLVALGVEVEL